MKKFLTITLLTLFILSFPASIILSGNVSAQTSTPFGLTDGTPIRLRTTRNLSSGEAKTGETVDFEVLEDVKTGDTILIARGATALGTVTNAKPKGRMGRGGKLDINIDSVRLVNGDKVALRAVKENKGGGHTGAMTGAIVASSILFFPAAPFFLLMKGKDISIPKGTEITAYVNGDVPLDAQKFGTLNTSTSIVSNVGTSATAGMANVSVKSTPDGSDITVDGKFVGSTPSNIQLSSGDHKISVSHSGFVVWEKIISITAGGSVNLNANLEKNH